MKTADSKYITLTNSTGKVLRSIYLRTSGNEDWGSDLIPVEASVKASEQVQMYYTPAQEEDAVYDMQIVISDDEVYEIYSVDLSDMEKASLDFQDDTAFLRYMSLSSKKEMNTRDNEPVSDDSYDDYGNESYGGSDDQNDYDNGYDNGYDDSYDPDYDNGYDDGDDNSTDVGTDDGNGDGGDGQGTDDGNGDDGGDDTGDGDDGGGDIVWDENGNWTEG